MTNKRALISSIAAGALVLLAAVFLLAPSDPADRAPLPRLAQPDGETVGWVSKVEASTIHVNSGPFGGGIVALVVTRDTRITVGAKEGWFEDIRPGGQVKVSYDMFEGRRMARTVEILVDEGARRLTRAEPRVRGTIGTARTERVPDEAKSPAESPPVAAEKGAERAATPAPAPTMPATTLAEKPTATAGEKPPALASEKQTTMVSEKSAGSAPPPARVVRPAEAERGRTPTAAGRSGGSQEAARVHEAPPRIPAAVRPSGAGRAESGGTTDGSEAVDWLLKQRN